MKTTLWFCLAAAFLAGCAGRGGSPLVPAAAPAAGSIERDAALSAFPSGVPEQSLGAVRFVVSLPLRNEVELDRLLATISDPDSPEFRHFITPEAFDERYAPLGADLAAVASDLRRGGFNVSVTDQAVLAGGTQSRVERYFRTTFASSAEGVLAPRVAMTLPRTLASRRASVLGLDGTPLMHTFSRFVPVPAGMHPHNQFGTKGPYYPIDLKQAYQMPSYQEATGKGVTIGIVIDSTVESKDITDFFKKNLGLPPLKMTIVKVNGGSHSTADIGESTLDVQQSGGIAPGAHVIVYEIPELSNTDIYNGYAAAINAKSATLVNSSFGGCEGFQTATSLAQFDALYKQGIAIGMTFVAASGDHGSNQCGSSNNYPTWLKLGVSWPADSPYVLAVGGSNLITQFASGSNNSAYVRESADKDVKPTNGGSYWGSGGGYSVMYPRPSWQNGYVTKNARGLPDVAGHMGGLGGLGGCQAQKCSPDDSSDLLLQGGTTYYSIGTSASSPDTVGLLALATELFKSPLGDVHALIYKAAKTPGLFHRGIKGNNGQYSTTSGIWDPVLGLGTPDAAYKLVGASAPAGVPGTSTNP